MNPTSEKTKDKEKRIGACKYTDVVKYQLSRGDIFQNSDLAALDSLLHRLDHIQSPRREELFVDIVLQSAWAKRSNWQARLKRAA